MASGSGGFRDYGKEKEMTMPALMNCKHSADGWCIECVKKLTRDRDAWKASHDNQVKLRRTLMDRPDLKERAALVQKMEDELETIKRNTATQIHLDPEMTYSDDFGWAHIIQHEILEEHKKLLAKAQDALWCNCKYGNTCQICDTKKAIADAVGESGIQDPFKLAREFLDSNGIGYSTSKQETPPET